MKSLRYFKSIKWTSKSGGTTPLPRGLAVEMVYATAETVLIPMTKHKPLLVSAVMVPFRLLKIPLVQTCSGRIVPFDGVVAYRPSNTAMRYCLFSTTAQSRRRTYKDVTTRLSTQQELYENEWFHKHQNVPFYEIALDTAVLRSFQQRQLLIPSRPLACAIAKEWQDQKETIRVSSMPLMMILSSVIDTVLDNKEETVDKILQYLHNDTVCFRVEKLNSLSSQTAHSKTAEATGSASISTSDSTSTHWIHAGRPGKDHHALERGSLKRSFGSYDDANANQICKHDESSLNNLKAVKSTPAYLLENVLQNRGNLLTAQQLILDPILLNFEKAYSVRLERTYGIYGGRQCEETELIIQTYLRTQMNPYALTALNFATSRLKSLVLALYYLDENMSFTAEDVYTAANLEELIQRYQWGEVEGDHNVEQEDAYAWLNAIKFFYNHTKHI